MSAKEVTDELEPRPLRGREPNLRFTLNVNERIS